jgi:hypothetical protein
VYATKACTVENLDRNHKNRNIYILSDSQAAIKPLGKHQITSELVWDCHQSLVLLATQNTVRLIWVPGHEDVVGNEMADKLARMGSEHLFTGPDPGCGISIGVDKKAVRDWTKKNHKRHCESVTGLRQAKALTLVPSARRMMNLLKLNRNQLRWVVQLFTGHCHLKGNLFKLGLTHKHTCKKMPRRR